MSNEEKNWHGGKLTVIRKGGGGSGAIYGIGILGALVYFIQHSANFTDGLLGIIKAILWPALLVYKALENFKF